MNQTIAPESDSQVGGSNTGSSLSIRSMTAKYGSVTAVESLDLDVREGEMLVLLGPSGCGKTTTMRSIAGLETPSEGSILIRESPVFDTATNVNVPPNRRQIGMVFQSYAIWPHRTVHQNVAFPMEVAKERRDVIHRRVVDLLELVGLGGFSDRRAGMLSGGQMQRVALARALATEPRLLLLDEPLSNLDAKLRDRLRFELRALQRRLGLTTIYVTHDQSEALALADRIAIMRAGKIVQMDEPLTLYKNPANRFVAEFLGTANVFPCSGLKPEAEGIAITVVGWPSALLSDRTIPKSSGNPVVRIRPESVELRELSSKPRGARNAFVGIVEVTSFMGSYAEYQVRVDNGPVLRVFSSAGEALLAEGSRVEISIAPSAVEIVPDDDPQGADPDAAETSDDSE